MEDDCPDDGIHPIETLPHVHAFVDPILKPLVFILHRFNIPGQKRHVVLLASVVDVTADAVMLRRDVEEE